MKDYVQDLTVLDHILTRYVIPFGSKVLGAFLIWFIGGMLVRTSQKILMSSLDRRSVDPTLVSYANSTLGFLLKGLLVLGILGLFGIETTSFSAILAAAGVAIGVAWSGLLSNFAAGIFLILFRPFKVGESIQAAGVTGIVREIGLFATAIDNGDNLRVFVGNNKLFSDNILNYSANPYRVATFRVQLAQAVDPLQAIDFFVPKLRHLDGIERNPDASGEITEFNTLGTVISLKVACHNRVYASVVSAGNELIYKALKEAKYPNPEAKTILIQA